jgi:cytoskeletal protein CcmA (bactofilin family)
MFNQDKSSKKKSKEESRFDKAVTILTPGCHFNGKLYCRGSSRIGGRIEGEIVSDGMLILEETSIITAEIKTSEAIVQGKVKGHLTATERVELKPDCCFEGDIKTPVLIVHEGATFNGNCTMSKDLKNELTTAPKEAKTKDAKMTNVENLYQPNKKIPDRQEIGIN